ncbi:hypothetical protein CHLNCDRAFT_139616 [Chlorella variabilis]|uniref:NADH dehydrogenase [ubiquinone] 1 beta subcomplex subunit 4 n=1 Tax=Chlorella variabilis TaxID=554065 RepID=E1ZQJ4_CHLVA|nr:hypothetical protein CHLNCDRAFT_139616 [Chlorella variabilis]EFN51950.1 hypothetical protein CHLNCDRAFT_139616 [Chlorella variabilis]|eukprot:XP_005844052.1 hypothetical protein CHLNCDRAFT_139616 [Chlorella variabilis]
MSLLRQAASQLRGRTAAAAQHQQQRLAGNLPVKPNKFVEEWGTRREHVENEFRWDAKTLMTIALWVGVAPYAVYKGSIGEFNHVDRAYNRSERAMLGNTK